MAYPYWCERSYRIYFRSNKHLFMYAMSDKKVDINSIPISEDIYINAIEKFEDALLVLMEPRNSRHGR